MDLNELKKPFPIEKISWRVGATTKDKTKAIPLAYIDARDVMERLDEVCGPENWQALYPHANGKTSCKIGIKIDDEWVWKENGAGDSDVEGVKGAFSDAFKRSAVLWGVGRYLYDVPNIWVEIDEYKKFVNPNDARFEGALKKAERIALGEKVDVHLPGEPVTKKPVTETEMGLILQNLDGAADELELESAKEIARSAYPRMEGTQKAKITKKINEKDIEISNRTLDKQAERQMA